jgi:hypothetical protein
MKQGNRAPRWLLIASTLLFLSTLACSSLSQSSESGGLETESNGLSPSLPFSDDFSDQNSGWPHADEGDSATEYVDGSYRIYIDNAESPYVLKRAMLAGEYKDVIMEVTARFEAGQDNNSSGLICRYSDDGYYYFDIAPEGDIRIARFLKGEQEILARIEGSTLVNPDENHLRVECVGDDLALFLNGEQVATASDGNLSDGQVGLIGGGGS